MLFTDSDHVTQEELQAIDTELPQVAAAQKITLDGSLGVIRANWDECAGMLSRAIGYRTNNSGVDPVLAFHMRTVQFVGLNQLALTPQFANSVSPWKKWLIYEALRRVYRSATQRNSRDGDRFQDKFERCTEDANAAYRQAASFGLPIIRNPLSAPGAVHDLLAGSWTEANLTTIAQSPTEARDIFIAITWVSDRANANNESGASALLPKALAADEAVRISIANLGAPGTEAHPTTRTGGYYATGLATHWNVYAGVSRDGLRKQYPTPIPLSTATWDLAGALSTSGAKLDSGQQPEFIEPLPNIIYRA
jgi:hypothetical protein